MPTINDLRQQAATIKNATQVGENTATRVGTTFETIADLLEGASVGQGVPSVDLSQLNTLRTPADQTTANPTIYNVTTLHNLSSTTIKVGTLFIFSDGGRAVVTQILLSNYQVDGGGNISSPNTSQITMYYRMFNIVQETWSAWTLYAGGGGGGTIDPYPVSGSDNAVASNGVFEGLQKAAPEVNINDLDDLGDFVDMRTGESSAYTLKYMHTQSSTWLRVGVVMCFANQAQNTLAQIVFSNCVVDGGGNLIPNSTTNVMNIYYRFKQFSGNPPEGMTIGEWTTWAKFGDSGYQPDNEDIDLNANDQLQFANKAYDASAFSGLGRVYLRKNIVQLNLTDKYFDGFVNDVLVQNVGTSSTPDAILFDTTRKMFVARVGLLYYVDWSSDEDYNPITRDVNWNYNGDFYRWNGEELVQWDKTINQLTQAMMNTVNTIYHIQYDYDLNGQTITLPAGCVLEFDGGSVKNGTINGVNTKISAQSTKIFQENVIFGGTWDVVSVFPSWFGCYSDGIHDDSIAVFNAIRFAISCKCKVIIDKDYYISLSAITTNIANTENETPINSALLIENADGLEISGSGRIVTMGSISEEIINHNNSIFAFKDCSNIVINTTFVGNGYNINNNTPYLSFIHCLCDCYNFDVNLQAFGARYAFRHGAYRDYVVNGTTGMSMSKINIVGENLGYPISIEHGAQLSLNVNAKQFHRALYLRGCDQALINTRTYTQYSAGVLIKLGDTLFKNGENILENKACSNIIVNAIDLGSSSVVDEEEKQTAIVDLARYSEAQIPYYNSIVFENIEINTTTTGGNTCSVNITIDESDIEKQSCDILYKNISVNIIDKDSSYPNNYVLSLAGFPKYGKVENFSVTANTNRRIYVGSRCHNSDIKIFNTQCKDITFYLRFGGVENFTFKNVRCNAFVISDNGYENKNSLHLDNCDVATDISSFISTFNEKNVKSDNPMHSVYTLMGASWNGVLWELNGLELTNDEIDNVFAKSSVFNLGNPTYRLSTRTLFPRDFANGWQYVDMISAFQYSTIETIKLSNQTSVFIVSNMSNAFSYCSNLTTIYDIIDLGQISAASKLTRAFYSCTNLSYVRLKNLKVSIDFSQSSKLGKESILYMIENSAATTAITITLHPTAYALATTDSDITAALGVKTNISLASA